MEKAREETNLQARTIRQLLVTYLTSVRGGAALKAMMETLVGDGGRCEMQKLSEEEQRVCVLKEVEKYNENESGGGGLFTWLGGIGMNEEPEKVSVQPDATVEELWRRLLQYEQSR